jgi:hypothetical protein
MAWRLDPARLPRHLQLLVAAYGVASLVHFAHNAEYVAFYPNLPSWVSREWVYGAWLAVTAVGVGAVALALAGWRIAGGLGLAAYGVLGLTGLGHYTLALCSEHSLAMNLTIWSEALAGLALAACAAWHLANTLRGRGMRVALGSRPK